MKMVVAKRKRDLEAGYSVPDQQLLDPGWSQVTLKPQLSQSGIPLPGSVQHPLWIQPISRRFT